MRMKNGMAIVEEETAGEIGPVDQDPAVLAATLTRDEAAAVLVVAEAKLRALHEIISPPRREVRVPVTTKVMAFIKGQGFAQRDATGYDLRVEQDEPDLRAVRRAQL